MGEHDSYTRLSFLIALLARNDTLRVFGFLVLSNEEYYLFQCSLHAPFAIGLVLLS